MDKIRRRLKNYEAKRLSSSFTKKLNPSAVLVPLYVCQDKVWMLLTRRTDTVSHHKCQISFPGGRRDESDRDEAHTALREFEEEMGIPASKVEIFGRLDEQPVITRYCIAPFVGELEYPFTSNPNADEIEDVLPMPLDEFLVPENHRLTEQEFEGRVFPIHYFQIGRETVWGATGRIIADLLEVCFDYRPPDYESFLEKRGE